ncbi:proline--tRNA ligase, mitochondrial [Lecanosticta acicola]|uniref:proline--tRNA ligase n=1 Tax=Lecanosticta acicola TaxID=111012 RepID=A0AAI9EBA1_9PEZI|nr:proline--tRNA ligase, mitochondrial [Lecanosticta acicola]
MLPLGLRVLDKIERLVDKHMQSLGASKVSLSSLSSQDLWRKSSRLDGRNAELFQLEDRRKAKFLLAPTHEEEITTIVKDSVHSYKDLPLRLYQVSRKYRDEARPRQGLLRGREFIMKDLYTFDETEIQATKTYESVRAAYQSFLDEFHLPYLVASADSGNMGGTHSHEYHFASSKGEDVIITCSSCDLSINEELYVGRYDPDRQVTRAPGSPSVTASGEKTSSDDFQFHMWIGQLARHSTNQPRTLVQVIVPYGHEVNVRTLKTLVPDLDTAQEQWDLEQLRKECSAGWNLLSFRDPRVPVESIRENTGFWNQSEVHQKLKPATIEPASFLLTKAHSTDPCPACGAEGALKLNKAVEIGHTFHLGKRYSKPLEASVKDESNKLVGIEMGCHGIGVSRLMAAVASLLADSKGLNWPTAIAPFNILLMGTPSTAREHVTEVYDALRPTLASQDLDLIMDDRERPVGWKLNDADLVGYPFIVILGKAWSQRKAVELQCRRLHVKQEVDVSHLAEKISEYRSKL